MYVPEMTGTGEMKINALCKSYITQFTKSTYTICDLVKSKCKF